MKLYRHLKEKKRKEKRNSGRGKALNPLTGSPIHNIANLIVTIIGPGNRRHNPGIIPNNHDLATGG